MSDQPVVEPEVIEEKKERTLNDLKIGYVVGLEENGDFLFELFGTDRRLVELLGLHKYASYRIDTIRNDKFLSGDALTHEVGKGVKALNEKLDTLLSLLKKSDNKL